MAHKKKHHSDPIVGGESEKEGRAMGHGMFANMPTDIKMKAYPKAHEFGPSVEDDTMGRIDAENGRAETKSRRFVSNQH